MSLLYNPLKLFSNPIIWTHSEEEDEDLYRRNDGEKDRETFADQGTVEIFREKTIEDMIDEQRAKLAAEGKVGPEMFEIWVINSRNHTHISLHVLDANVIWVPTAVLYRISGIHLPCRRKDKYFFLECWL